MREKSWAHPDHDRVSTSTQLLESGDQASCLCAEGMWIALAAGINCRTMRPLDQIHERVPEFDQLTPRREMARSDERGPGGGRSARAAW